MIFKIEINNAMSSKYVRDIFYFCIYVIILQNLIWKKNILGKPTLWRRIVELFLPTVTKEVGVQSSSVYG